MFNLKCQNFARNSFKEAFSFYFQFILINLAILKIYLFLKCDLRKNYVFNIFGNFQESTTIGSIGAS